MAKNQRNSSFKLSLSIFILFYIGIVIGFSIATQYFAAQFNYQSGLGSAIITFKNGIKIYQPFACIGWSINWFNASGPVAGYLTKMHLILIFNFIINIVVAKYRMYRRSLKVELPEDLHGSARFAVEKDVEMMNLISHYKRGEKILSRKVKYQARGIYVGAFPTKNGLKIMRYNDPAHILCYAPTRSGKGVGLVLPTLLSYPHSVATNDIKGENFELTSGFRHTAGSLVIRFDPTAVEKKSIDGKHNYIATSQWNALEEIRRFTIYDVMDAQNIAAAIADPNGEGMDDHWVSTAYELLTGVILHVLYFERDKSLAGVATYLADPTFQDPAQMFERMLSANHDPHNLMQWSDSSGIRTNTHPTVALTARAMLNKEDRERNSVLSTAKTKLSLFSEPVVAGNTRHSDFKMQDLMNHDKPVSLYIIVPPSDKERLRPLVRLFITYLLRCLTASMEFEDGRSIKSYRHRLLLLIDELPSLKKLDVLQDSLAFLAGYGITAFLLAQDANQLCSNEAYGQNETISAGCQLKIAFAPNTLKTAEELSNMTGKTTRKRQSISYSGDRISSMLNHMNISEELIERPLLTPDEVMRLPRDELLILNAGHPVIRGKKLYYYKMPVFLKRSKMASPSRVTLTYHTEHDKLHHTWFMVACERIPNSNEFTVIINCYDLYPPVRVLLKQKNILTGELIELECELVNSINQVIHRALTVDDLHFRIRPIKNHPKFDPLEAYEVHFLVRDPTPYPNLMQQGFFQDISAYERHARQQVRDYFHQLEMKEGIVIDFNIEKCLPNTRYVGQVLMHTEHYLVLQKNKESLSLHRKITLDRLPQTGEHVTIFYQNNQGHVS
jgi:type IV secretion system protein VirD4